MIRKRTRLFFLLLASFPAFEAFADPGRHPEGGQCILISQALVRPDTCGAGRGSILISHNGTAPFTYQWSHNAGLNDSLAAGLAAGTYTVQISDAAGCRADTTLVLAGGLPMQLATASFPDTCGAGRGRALASIVAGGAAPFAYQWDAAAGNAATPFTGSLPAGSYRISVSDANGCRVSDSVEILNETNRFLALVNPDSARCAGSADGRAVALPQNGAGLYSYRWENADGLLLGSDSIQTGLAAGIYVLSVSSGTAGCSTRINFLIREPLPLEARADWTPSSGCVTPNGVAIGAAVGGTTPYAYTWSNGFSGDTASGLRAGPYEVIVSDANGCRDTAEFILTSFSGPLFTVEVIQGDNCGLGQGIARANISVGTPPYSITWRTFPPQPADVLVANNLFRTATGSFFSVVIEDADSCINVQTFVVPGREPLRVVSTRSQAETCDLANGEAEVSIAGGTRPYRYQWTTSPVQRDSLATGLPDGIYQVSLLDSFNCDLRVQLSIADEPAHSLSIESTGESCFNAQDGSARVSVSGGRGPFRYAWSNGGDTPEQSGLLPGVYQVSVTGDDGCVREAFTVVREAPFLNAAFGSRPAPGTPRTLSHAFFEFFTLSQGADSLRWDFGDGSFSDDLAPAHRYADTGRYFVTLIAYNNGQCSDTFTLGPFVVEEDPTLFVPEAFTPNEDGFNDRLIVQGSRIDAFRMRVYSRWGELVFEAQSLQDAWDGRLKGGSAAPAGVYVYRMEAESPDGPIRRAGTITLLR